MATAPASATPNPAASTAPAAPPATPSADKPVTDTPPTLEAAKVVLVPGEPVYSVDGLTAGKKYLFRAIHGDIINPLTLDRFGTGDAKLAEFDAWISVQIQGGKIERVKAE